MKKIIASIFAGLCLMTSCEKYQTLTTVDTDFVTNYEAFWNMVNENYCFLGTAYGNDKNVDWQAVYDKWMPVVKNEVKDEYELFNIIGLSLDVLRDGHIWMKSDFKAYSNSEYLLMPDGVNYYSSNFVPGLVADCYFKLSTDKDDYKGNKLFRTVSGFNYGMIEREGKKIAYIYYNTFQNEMKEADMKRLVPFVEEADALIVDIRNNHGGTAMYGLDFAGYFFKEKTHVAYDAYKNGPGHDDFSEPTMTYVIPSQTYSWADKQTAVLIDREVYSTANLFTCVMKQAPNVTVVGQISGGGGGMPMSHYLPNGWDLVFSSNILLDQNMKHIEGGIEPDVEASIGDYKSTKKDGVVEKAVEELLKKI